MWLGVFWKNEEILGKRENFEFINELSWIEISRKPEKFDKITLYHFIYLKNISMSYKKF